MERERKQASVAATVVQTAWRLRNERQCTAAAARECQSWLRAALGAVVRIQAAERSVAARRFFAVTHAKPREIEPIELSDATDHFADVNVVGEGSFGVVYRASALPSLAIVRGPKAVKRARESSRDEREALWKEYVGRDPRQRVPATRPAGR